MDGTGLWAWFLFDSGLPAQRAKGLLSAWQDQGLTLEAALAQLPGRARTLGLTPAEAARLALPEQLPERSALCWDDAFYPRGLRALPLRVRPALLFYQGEPVLLSRPILTLAPSTLGGATGDASSPDRQLLRETLALLVGEAVLMAVYEGSDQAGLLLQEIADADGEALLFAKSGLDVRDPGPWEEALVEAGRLLIVSPLPGHVAYQPAWDQVLQEVAVAAAEALLLTGDAARLPQAVIGLGNKPAFAIAGATPEVSPAPNVQPSSNPAGVLTWLDDVLPTPGLDETITVEPDVDLADGEAEVELGPPPSPDEILDTLSKGGAIPDVLRKRLLGEE